MSAFRDLSPAWFEKRTKLIQRSRYTVIGNDIGGLSSLNLTVIGWLWRIASGSLYFVSWNACGNLSALLCFSLPHTYWILPSLWVFIVIQATSCITGPSFFKIYLQTKYRRQRQTLESSKQDKSGRTATEVPEVMTSSKLEESRGQGSGVPEWWALDHGKKSRVCQFRFRRINNQCTYPSKHNIHSVVNHKPVRQKPSYEDGLSRKNIDFTFGN